MTTVARGRTTVLALAACLLAGLPSATNVSAAVSRETLTDVRDAAHRVQTAALDVVNDVEQRKLAPLEGDIAFIQPFEYKNTKSSLWKAEMKKLGKIQPPKKSWLQADVAHLGNRISVLQSEVSGSSSPEMAAIMNDVQSHYSALQKLAAGPTFDNLAIGSAALDIYDDMPKLEKPWKHAFASK